MFGRLFTPFRSPRQSAGSSALKRACLQVESLVGECMSGFCPRKPAASARAALVCEQLEVRVVPAATCTWLGTGGNFLASNPANWVGGVAPVAGDSILFPTTNPAPLHHRPDTSPGPLPTLRSRWPMLVPFPSNGI